MNGVNDIWKCLFKDFIAILCISIFNIKMSKDVESSSLILDVCLFVCLFVWSAVSTSSIFSDSRV